MYRVYMDHELVYMPGDRTLALFSAKAELKVNGTGSFTFTMYPDHPAYGKLELMRNIIAIHSDSQSDPLFLCRPYQIEYGTHNEAKVSCEGTLGFLNDSLVEPVNMDFADNPMNPVTLLGYTSIKNDLTLKPQQNRYLRFLRVLRPFRLVKIHPVFRPRRCWKSEPNSFLSSRSSVNRE